MTDETEVKTPLKSIYPDRIIFPRLEAEKRFVIQDVPESELKAAVTNLPKLHRRRRY